MKSTYPKDQAAITNLATSDPPKEHKTKPKNQLESKNWLPISNQKWSAHQTLVPN